MLLRQIYLSRWGDDITKDILELAEEIKANPTIRVEFEEDCSGCYYEGDHPSYLLNVFGD